MKNNMAASVTKKMEEVRIYSVVFVVLDSSIHYAPGDMLSATEGTTTASSTRQVTKSWVLNLRNMCWFQQK
jgi:hypothetical protein